MTAQPKDEGAVSRLTELGNQLAEVYPDAGNRVAQAIKPVDEAIQKIGLCFRKQHRAEYNRSLHFTQRPWTFFEEEQEEDCSVEYALCAARVNRACRLAVSVCRYRVVGEEYRDDEGRAQSEDTAIVESVYTVLPSELPLPLRLKILDTIEDFAKGYEEYVREDRKKLLNGSVVPKPQ